MANRIRMGLMALGLRQDPDTFSHCVRVGMLAKAMARALRMPNDEERKFIAACSFHDVGKLFVPKEILAKRLPLDEDETAKLREHPLLGARLLQSTLGWDDPHMLATVRSHHERWDGGGYPDGLSGAEIPPWARMCAVIDAYDAMVEPRPYCRVKSPEEAREELRSQRGSHFDETYVDLFLGIPEISIEKIRRCQ